MYAANVRRFVRWNRTLRLWLRDLSGISDFGPLEILDQASDRFVRGQRIRAYQFPAFFAELLDVLLLIYPLIFLITVIDYFVLPLLSLGAALLGKRRWRQLRGAENHGHRHQAS